MFAPVNQCLVFGLLDSEMRKLVFSVHKEGSPVSKEDYQRLKNEFNEKLTTRVKDKFSTRTEFDRRRASDEFLKDQGYTRRIAPKLWLRRQRNLEYVC